MTAKNLRQVFLDFFVKRGHKVIPSASLIPTTEVEIVQTKKVLFTTAGMHPLIPFLLGTPHPAGTRLVNFQKCLRTDDIEEVGDNWHNTFFEMLGNWSFGDYWKKEAILWSFEFLTKVLGIKKDQIWVTVFGGDSKLPGIPEDSESAAIWKNLGIESGQIIKLGKKDNWWGPVGETGPCGPDCEMFVDVRGYPHGPDCKPGDDCGRFAEVWNDVFMEFAKTQDGKYQPLKQKNVDTGMGVERTIAVLQGKNNIYETELFKEVVDLLKQKSKIRFNLKDVRIISDHMRASIFLLAEGLRPSNKDQGYVLRRLIRRSEAKAAYGLGIASFPFTDILNIYAEIYEDFYPEITNKKREIDRYLLKEIVSFNTALEKAFKEFEKIKSKNPQIIPGKELFYLHATHGLTKDIIKDFAEFEAVKIDEKGFEEEFAKHQEISRAGIEKKFAGGLVEHSQKAVAGHTATHLLHQALRDVLGKHVVQTGSNITAERIRFDFVHNAKISDKEIEKVEEIVNEKISAALPVKKEIMKTSKAYRIGAIGLFGEKYGDKVSVYFIGDFSKEFCGGPHVKNTKSLGRFKIIKEESQGAGKRRIYAKLENSK